MSQPIRLCPQTRFSIIPGQHQDVHCVILRFGPNRPRSIDSCLEVCGKHFDRGNLRIYECSVVCIWVHNHFGAGQNFLGLVFVTGEDDLVRTAFGAAVIHSRSNNSIICTIHYRLTERRAAAKKASVLSFSTESLVASARDNLEICKFLTAYS